MPLVVAMPASPENYQISRDIFKNLDLENIPSFILVTHHLNNYSTGFDAIKTNIDEKHVDLPSTEKLIDLYKFEVICDNDLNFRDNTVAGNIFQNPKLKFIPNRGSWFSIPLNVLKKG